MAAMGERSDDHDSDELADTQASSPADIPLSEAPTAAHAGTVADAPIRLSQRMLEGWKRGDTIGRFVVLAPLGAGGMGFVLSAYDPQLDRKVAIKVVRPEHAARPGATSAARSRLLREAQA